MLLLSVVYGLILTPHLVMYVLCLGELNLILPEGQGLFAQYLDPTPQ